MMKTILLAAATLCAALTIAATVAAAYQVELPVGVMLMMMPLPFGALSTMILAHLYAIAGEAIEKASA